MLGFLALHHFYALRPVQNGSGCAGYMFKYIIAKGSFNFESISTDISSYEFDKHWFKHSHNDPFITRSVAFDCITMTS